MKDILNIQSIDRASFGYFNKSVDKSLAYIGDVLTYTVTFINTGSLTAKNTIFIDTLPIGTSFVKDSIVYNGTKQLGMGFNFEKGIAMGDIYANTENSLSFKVVVTTLPNGNKTFNSSELSYKYKIANVDTIPAYDSSNMAITLVTINYIVLNSTEYVNKNFAKVGDTLTYSIVYENNGNTAANEVIIYNVIPEGGRFVTDSLKVNEVLQPGMNISTPFKLNNINIGITTISYNVIVDTIPNVNPMKSSTFTSYKYTVQITLPNNSVGAIRSNIASTKINSVFVYGTKIVDKSYVDIGDTITYTIRISTLGNVMANNIIIFDTISNECSYLENSLKINGVVKSLGYCNNCFDIGTLPFGISTITYKVVVNTIPMQNPIKSNGIISYSYTVDPSYINADKDYIELNTVETKLNTVFLEGKKYVDKMYSDVGETLKYTITLNNSGVVEATNVIVEEVISNEVSLIKDSLTINDVFEPIIGNNTLFSIGTVPVGTTTITFSVNVETLPANNVIKNTALVRYRYTVDPSVVNEKEKLINTNISVTTVNRSFLQVSNNVNKDYCDIGEELTYTVSIKNVGNTSANNVVLKETLPRNSSYISSTAVLNGNISLNNINFNSLENTLDIDMGNLQVGLHTLNFNVLVDTLPSINPISNTGTIFYSYTVDPSIINGVSRNIEINEAKTFVNTVVLNGVSNVDKVYADLGDSIVYTILLKNSGNIEGEDIILINTIPEGCKFVSADVNINGQIYNLEEKNSIFSIGTLPVGLSTITIKVLAVTIPSTGIAKNSFTVNYKYSIDPGKTIVYSNSIITNNIETNINSGILEVINFVDKKYVDIGDEITYYSRLTNKGNVDIINIIFRDTIPSGTTFIEDSVFIDSLSIPGESPLLGVSIDNISPEMTTTISYKINIETIPEENPLPTSNMITYAYNVDNASYIKNKVENGNIEYTKINTVFLSASESVDKSYASVGDTLIYTIQIVNTGTTYARDMFIKATIPNDTTFVYDSLRVNGLTQTGENIFNGFSLDKVEIGITTIDFRLQVDTIPSPNINSIDAEIKYSYDVDKDLLYNKSGVIVTNSVNTQVYMASINSSKIADKKYANIGDTVSYILLINNNGNTNAKDAVLKDILCEKITLVEGSLNINGSSITNNIVENYGIKIGNIPIGINTINFDIKILGVPSVNPIGEKYFISYKYAVDPLGAQEYNFTHFNTAETTQINYINLDKAYKTVDKNYATCDDILTYTIIVPNTGNVDAINLVISDTIPEGTEFLDGTLVLDGNTIPGDPTYITIGTIPKGEVATINFKAKVICGGGIF